MAFISNLYLAFSCVANTYKNRVALSYPATGVRTTYRELNILADRIAKALWSKGLRQGQVAAIFHDKSPAAFAAMIACLRLGIIYTNLDPASPWERVRKILVSCKPTTVVNAFELPPFAKELTDAGYNQILHLRDLVETADPCDLPATGGVSGGSPAYIMFTSGSTGYPKGAVMSHANVLWFVQWVKERFGINHQDVLTNVNPIYFDNSVFDFYSAILSGATLVPFSPEQVKDGRSLLKLAALARCTIWFSVPSLLVYLLTTRALEKYHFADIRKIIFGGEGFPKARLKELFELFGDRSDLENVYGPTECTCICSAKTITAEDFRDMHSLAPLGALAQNFDAEILPQDPSNPNFGELFLRGPQVGLGYYSDPERTTRAFTQNPTHLLYADVGYRTGDLVLRDADGCLHFKGRADYQIKHMGYRIELEEIEAAVNTIAGVTECAVIYQRAEGGLGQILAFVGCAHAALTSRDVLLQLAAILPPYMVPRRVEMCHELPKNANGKIDRNSLQAT